MTGWLIEIAKMTIVIALALGAMPLLRNRSAALRHWVLIAALGCAVAQPLFSVMAPRWTLPSTGWMRTSPEVVSETTVMLLETTAPRNDAERDEGATTPISLGRNDITQLLVAIWLSGAIIGLCALAIGLVRLARITSQSHDAADAWRTATGELSTALGIARPVPTLVTDHAALLVTWGVRRPIVLVPRDGVAWPMDRIRAVVSHELAHVRRKDWPTQLAAEVVRAVLWFHPLVWIACARLRHEAERACDDLVLGLGIDRTSYASDLVALARAFKAHKRPWLPAPAISRPSTLQWRIRAMLNLNVDRRPVSSSMRAATLAVLLAASVSIAGLHAQTTSVSGSLRDTSGRVLPEATVRLVHPQSSAKYETQSDANGSFQFTAVAPGDYVLSVRLAGFSTVVDTVALAAGGSVRRELTLQVGSLQETISVRGGAPEPAKSREPREAPYAMPACTPSSAGGQIVPPRKIRNVLPEYPQALQDAKITGTVILVAHIGADGVVNDVRPFSSGDPGLEEAAIVAVKQWRFTPTLLNCQPIEVQMLATVTFSLTP